MASSLSGQDDAIIFSLQNKHSNLLKEKQLVIHITDIKKLTIHNAELT